MLSKDKIRQNVIKYPPRKEASETFHIWPHRLSVRTPGFHPGKSGSTPGGATIKLFTNMSIELFLNKLEKNSINVKLFKS